MTVTVSSMSGIVLHTPPEGHTDEDGEVSVPSLLVCSHSWVQYQVEPMITGKLMYNCIFTKDNLQHGIFETSPSISYG